MIGFPSSFLAMRFGHPSDRQGYTRNVDDGSKFRSYARIDACLSKL